jgi:hypothetical protein
MTQAFNLSQLANNLNTSGQLDATDGLTGAVPVANGGTGQSSLTANAVVLGNGTSGVQTVAPSTSGNILTSNGTTWVSQAPSGGGVTSLNGQTGAITNTNLYVIGSYINGRPANLTSYAVNSTIAGSSLYSMMASGRWRDDNQWINPAGGTGVGENLINTGTWRCVSSAFLAGTSAYAGLWVRIS